MALMLKVACTCLGGAAGAHALVVAKLLVPLAWLLPRPEFFAIAWPPDHPVLPVCDPVDWVCAFGEAPTWPVEGAKALGGLIPTWLAELPVVWDPPPAEALP
jgi:hypothetical protein